MNVLLWVVAALLALLLADRLLLWVERRGWMYYRRHRAATGANSISSVMQELHMLFSPSRQHVKEEKERRLVLRDDDEAGEPLDRRIDLESGRVVVRQTLPPTKR
ncbi:DUF6191 domain-containing protein [Streptomyces vinaceus]|uniref:DUF6191 domain-containing protein n=1 Tax=Streptomyces vinaceus TaxID=1960 RepID=UPI00367B0483